MEQSQIVNPQVEAEIGSIVRTLLTESIRYDPAIHSKLCINGNLDEADMNTLFPELPESTFNKFKDNMKQTTLFKDLGLLKKTAVDFFLKESTIKKQLRETINNYCARCIFDCDTDTYDPAQWPSPMPQTPRYMPSRPPQQHQQTQPMLNPGPLLSNLYQRSPPSAPTKLQVYRNSLPQMSDENWGIHVGNMISYDGSNWLDKMQQQRSQQQQKSKNPFARKLGGGGPCEDVKKQELIGCIANGILTSISKKLSLAGGRVRRVRRTYKKSQQRQQKQTRKNTKQLRNKKRSIV